MLLYSIFTQTSEATSTVFAEMLKKRKSIFNLRQTSCVKNFRWYPDAWKNCMRLKVWLLLWEISGNLSWTSFSTPVVWKLSLKKLKDWKRNQNVLNFFHSLTQAVLHYSFFVYTKIRVNQIEDICWLMVDCYIWTGLSIRLKWSKQGSCVLLSLFNLDIASCS